jgi:arsenate reductase
MHHPIRVAFICVHNSCRSQIAEAFGHFFDPVGIQFFSGGTEIASHINPDAVRLMKQEYGVDMEASQKPKTLESLPDLDVVITMGCNVQCPYLPCSLREDWGLDDPTGKSDEVFLETIHKIEEKVNDLIRRLK